MKRSSQLMCLTIMAVLGLLILASCSNATEAAISTPMAISPTLTTTKTPTPDQTAAAEAHFQATLDSNKTQNAAYFATSEAMKTSRPPTMTPTRRPVATPTDEDSGMLVNGVLVHDADTRTGLEDIDQIINITLAKDMNEFRRRINFTASGCTHVMALGGPEKCKEGEAEGTLVEVLPVLGAGEGSHLRRDDLINWQGIDAAGLYAVYRVSDEEFSSQDYPAGEFGIVFLTNDPQNIVTLQVKYGSILRIDSTFIQQIDSEFSIPEALDFERIAEELILPPAHIKECPGAPLRRVMIGELANVCTQSEDLVLREEPGLDGKPVTGIEPGTEFMIIDGPSCANNWSWWKVELDSGLEGWIAEGGDNIDPYFICPEN
jgi:hypothetical protein